MTLTYKKLTNKTPLKLYLIFWSLSTRIIRRFLCSKNRFRYTKIALK